MFCNQDFQEMNEFTNIPGMMQKSEMIQDNKNIELPGVSCPSICECPQERCCTREIHHCVEHIVPINTRIINHHIYHHVYKPVYTCCEENICSCDNKCCM